MFITVREVFASEHEPWINSLKGEHKKQENLKMRKVILFTLSIIFTLNIVSAQARMVNEASFDKVSMAAYEIQIDVAPDRVIDLWDDFWDDRYKVDVDREDRNRNREIYMAKEVTVESISDKQIDIYSSITTTDEERAKVSLGFGVGYDVYVNQENFGTIFAAAERILNEFEAYSYQTVYSKIVEEREKMLKDAIDEKEDLQDDIKKNESDIESAQKKIADLESEIKKAQQDNEEARKKVVSTAERVSKLEVELRDAKQKLSKWQ